MGERIAASSFTRVDRERHGAQLARCVRALGRMVGEGRFAPERAVIGMEIELNLVDGRGRPRMVNDEVLSGIAKARLPSQFQRELGRFNLELNVAPRRLGGTVFTELAGELDQVVAHADTCAGAVGARTMQIGILPTLADTHMAVENISRQARYRALNEEIFAARGDRLRLDISGVERLRSTHATILPEACGTSVQLHLQLTPASFPAFYNAAQAVAGAQVAVGANAPFLFGRELWRETRPVLLAQAIDPRSAEMVARGLRPRVWFGEGWVSSVLGLFEDNVAHFPALLPESGAEDPLAVLDAGGVPALTELRLHSGTVYRWNRPVYDVADGHPHVRVENRVLPAGPTPTDMLANAAFFYGLVRSLAGAERPVWESMPFSAAAANFEAGARHGLEADLFWPGVGTVRAAELVAGELVPLAAEGLTAWGVEPCERDALLGVIEARCRRGVNGAVWQSTVYHRLRRRRGLLREAALEEMTCRYVALAGTGAPVHTWPLE